jgi:DNA-binding IclR family transcriptional regulator
MSEELGTVARTLSVLRAVAEAKSSVGVKDIAEAVNLPMSTSHRLLDLLLDAGFIEKDAARRRYRIGGELSRLANLIAAKTSFSSVVQPILDDLTSQTGETTIFASYLPARRAMTYSAKCDSPQLLRYRIGLHEEIPLSWGSTGLAILSVLPETIQAEVFASAKASPVHGRPLSRKAFYERIAVVQKDGVAITDGERLGDAFGIAAPIVTEPGNILGAIGFTIPKLRFTRSKQKTFVDLARRAADRVARHDVP